MDFDINIFVPNNYEISFDIPNISNDIITPWDPIGYTGNGEPFGLVNIELA